MNYLSGEALSRLEQAEKRAREAQERTERLNHLRQRDANSGARRHVKELLAILAPELASDVLWLVEQVRERDEVLRDALPSLGANRRSYAQRALERACEWLDENPDAWRGAGELALEQEWRRRVAVLEDALRGVLADNGNCTADEPQDASCPRCKARAVLSGEGSDQ